MKNSLIVFAFLSVMGASQMVAQNPFGKTYKMPCQMKNDATYFAATGTAYGEREELDMLLLDAHENATQQIYRRMQHVVEGKIKTFNETVGRGGKRERTMDNISAIERTIIDVLNAVENSCEEVSEIDEKGNISVYVGFQIPKQQVAEAFTQELSKGESAEVRKRAKEIGEQFMKEIKEIKDNNRKQNEDSEDSAE